jgi:hypothetical protein
MDTPNYNVVWLPICASASLIPQEFLLHHTYNITGQLKSFSNLISVLITVQFTYKFRYSSFTQEIYSIRTERHVVS